jgi:hypothetical protein
MADGCEHHAMSGTGRRPTLLHQGRRSIGCGSDLHFLELRLLFGISQLLVFLQLLFELHTEQVQAQGQPALTR